MSKNKDLIKKDLEVDYSEVFQQLKKNFPAAAPAGGGNGNKPSPAAKMPGLSQPKTGTSAKTPKIKSPHFKNPTASGEKTVGKPSMPMGSGMEQQPGQKFNKEEMGKGSGARSYAAESIRIHEARTREGSRMKGRDKGQKGVEREHGVYPGTSKRGDEVRSSRHSMRASRSPSAKSPLHAEAHRREGQQSMDRAKARARTNVKYLQSAPKPDLPKSEMTKSEIYAEVMGEYKPRFNDIKEIAKSNPDWALASVSMEDLEKKWGDGQTTKEDFSTHEGEGKKYPKAKLSLPGKKPGKSNFAQTHGQVSEKLANLNRIMEAKRAERVEKADTRHVIAGEHIPNDPGKPPKSKKMTKEDKGSGGQISKEEMEENKKKCKDEAMKEEIPANKIIKPSDSK